MSAFVDDVAGVQSRGRLEEHDPALLLGHGAMFNSARDDDEFAFLDPLVVVRKVHAEAAPDHEKHFVFVFVMVEDEFAYKLDQLDVLAVEFGGDVRLPVFGNPGELFGEVGFGHVDLTNTLRSRTDWMVQGCKSRNQRRSQVSSNQCAGAGCVVCGAVVLGLAKFTFGTWRDASDASKYASFGLNPDHPAKMLLGNCWM